MGIHLIFHKISSSLSASHFLFFSFLFYKILIAVCDASFQQQLNKNIGAANFLKSSSLFASHFHFYSFYYIRIAVCVCVRKNIAL